MKTKLLATVFIAFLSMTGLYAKADVVVDTSSCKVYNLAYQPGAFDVKGLVCLHEAPKSILKFFVISRYCQLQPQPGYRATGTCADYVLYRIE